MISKSGKESFKSNIQPLPHTLLDFYRWAYSDLLNNTTRGILAEYIVGTAIGLKKDAIREEWADYDLLTEDGIKIEVKSSAYIQSWAQKKYSTISFSIAPTTSWDAESNTFGHDKNAMRIYMSFVC